MIFIYIFLGIALLTNIVRPFVTLFHELGHALPILYFTRKKTIIYLGSYGDPEKSYRFSIGLLEIWFRFNPFEWWGGLCVATSNDMSIRQRMIYTVCGPLCSLVVGILACYFAFAFDSHGALKILLVAFMAFAIGDLYINLKPNKAPVHLYDGSIVYNDGHELLELFKLRTCYAEYDQAVSMYKQKNYTGTIAQMENLLSRGVESSGIYEYIIAAAIVLDDYEKALVFHNRLAAAYELNSDNYSNLGLIRSSLEGVDAGASAFEQALSMNPDNTHTLNAWGFHLAEANRFEEAILLLDKAIALDATYAYAYDNRGFAKMKAGEVEAGLADIKYSYELDPDNSYVHRNLGIYHLDQGDKLTALEYFNKARELDPNTLRLNDLIAEANG